MKDDTAADMYQTPNSDMYCIARQQAHRFISWEQILRISSLLHGKKNSFVGEQESIPILTERRMVN
jgi:hypothetical protein